jgi:hypothetical protein
MNMYFKLVVHILHRHMRIPLCISLQSLKFSGISAFNANEINPSNAAYNLICIVHQVSSIVKFSSTLNSIRKSMIVKLEENFAFK